MRLQIDQVIKEGGNPLALIRSGVKNELFSSEAAQALRGYYIAFVEHKRKVAAAEAAWSGGVMGGGPTATTVDSKYLPANCRA